MQSMATAAGVQRVQCPICLAHGVSRAAFVALRMTPDVFGALQERGWSRAGCTLYLPATSSPCGCRQRPMRVEADRFRPTRNQRRLLKAAARKPRLRKITGAVVGAMGLLGLLPAGRHFVYPMESWFIEARGGTASFVGLATLIGGDYDRSGALGHLVIHMIALIKGVAISDVTGDVIHFHLDATPSATSVCLCGANPDLIARHVLVGIVGDVAHVNVNRLNEWTRPMRLLTYDDGRIAGRTCRQLFGEYVDDNVVVNLERCSFSDEKFDLYRRYQVAVHGDTNPAPARDRFEENLVLTPIVAEPSSSYGSFHRCYRLRDSGRLIAFSLIDITAVGVTSGYFVWDQHWRPSGLGILSVLDEIDLVMRLQSFITIKPMYYLGMYSEKAEKVKYKKQFQPFELFENQRWVRSIASDEVHGEPDWQLPAGCIQPRQLVGIGNTIDTFMEIDRLRPFTTDELTQLIRFSSFVGDMYCHFAYVLDIDRTESDSSDITISMSMGSSSPEDSSS